MGKHDGHDDPKQAARELHEERRNEAQELREAEGPPETARRERLREGERSETEREGRKTRKDYA